jgi:hypothetical protein
MPEMDTPSHTEGTPRGEDQGGGSTETQGPTNRPVGQVEDDPMEPKNSGSGTEGMG